MCWRRNKTSKTEVELGQKEIVAVFREGIRTDQPFRAHVATAGPCRMRVTETLGQREGQNLIFILKALFFWE